MTSRERVFRTLEFNKPDCAPRCLWRLPWVEMFAAEQLEAVLGEFPEDFTGPTEPVFPPGERCRGIQNRKGTYVDDWGCPWEVAEDGVSGEVRQPPLADWSALDGFAPPWEILQAADWDAVNRSQEKNLASQPKFMLCGTTIRPFERMQFLRGSENLFMDLGYDSAEFRRLREMVHEFNLRELEGWVKTDCDGLSFMDDWGSQTALLISPAMWREVFKPLYKEYCDMIHAAGKKVFFHSDGHIFDIYEDLIEIGIDAVNSQLFCMDIEEIGRRFKGRITFWGEIDRQHILPLGTVEDVRKAVSRARRALDDGTGGVIAQCEWGSDNPMENIREVFKAWQTPIEELP
ncbi:MAG: methyltransferase [Phycisphaerae bacterium]|nr:methyltransferase [Phycisphaerae bacterium]